ncbi:hypothetical protein N657DRAFT_680884 [Parathielavia appendiculata]|uniref:AMP-activated protein kinase glycogen-binding domain-containing protein n=1 Tax=Parathielavia appendiculata TaxID=2587402 RepID=A0AAN6Z3L2_9PEZI|nr:hypothetical protein N657DRAFT_680884 [Parathielavia appendiculata]
MTSTQIPVVITYHKPGTQPPIYVAGTFSNPPWQPYEMERTRRDDGNYDFTKEIRAEPGSKIQYKFRVGNGDWWVLKDDAPTVTDSAGNTNHVLEVKPHGEPSHEYSAEFRDSQQRKDVGSDAPLSYAKIAAKHVQPSAEEAAVDRSTTGTPIFARVAAEVADSAELLHEEVPERRDPEAGASGDSGEKAGDSRAAEAVPAPKAPESLESTVVILEPPPGEGRPLKEEPRGREAGDEQEDFIADKSPLFAHECVGMYESDEETGQEDTAEEDVAEDDERFYRSLVEDIDPDQIDLNDPTLERFPSARDDIMQAVRKLETGLPADQASFEGNPRSPVVNPARRGTEDITGDFHLSAPQTPASSRRSSKRSPRGSVSSIHATASLHSISEAEEQAAEQEAANFRPAVVFSNPLKPKPKTLKLPTSEEDEGVVLRDGLSPRTVKPMHRPIPMAEPSPPQSPPSTRDSSRSLAPAEVELDKDKERSMQEVFIRPAPQAENPGPAQADPPDTTTKKADRPGEPSYAQAAAADTAASEPPSQSKAVTSQSHNAESPTSSKDTASHDPRARRPSYAEVAASKPSPTEPPSAASPSEIKNKGQQQEATKQKPRRLSYAEVVALPPQPAAPPSDSDKKAAQAPSHPSTTSVATAESSTSTAARASVSKDDWDKNKVQELLRKRVMPGGKQREGEMAKSPDSAAAATAGGGGGGGGGDNMQAVQPKRRRGWLRAILRFVFVEVIGRIIKSVLRVFGIGGRRGAARREGVRT